MTQSDEDAYKTSVKEYFFDDWFVFRDGVEFAERSQKIIKRQFVRLGRKRAPDPITAVKRIERRLDRRVAAYAVGDDGRLQSVTFTDGIQHQLSDAERELAEFEARHGQA